MNPTDGLSYWGMMQRTIEEIETQQKPTKKWISGKSSTGKRKSTAPKSSKEKRARKKKRKRKKK